MPGWLGWTVLYAAAIWGIDVVYGLLGPWLNATSRRVQEVAAAVRFFVPLGLAFLIGLQVRAWWWALSPFLVMVVTMLAFSVVDYLRRPPAERQQVAAALILATGATVLEAALAVLAAIAGLVTGRWWQGD